MQDLLSATRVPIWSVAALHDAIAGVTDRSARRYVAILREAGIPVEAVRGPYGGYRLGRGLQRGLTPPFPHQATLSRAAQRPPDLRSAWPKLCRLEFRA